MKFYIEKEIDTVGCGKADATLSVYENKYDFVQSFQRAWTPLSFETPLDALNFMRTIRPELHLVLNSEESKIINVQNDWCFENFSIVGDL